MSYSPPSGSAVNFAGTGVVYTAPAGNAVNFTLEQGDPKFSIAPKSTLSFRSGSSFSILSGTSTAFENPFRVFSIASNSSALFNTSQRNFNINSSSVSRFNYGFIATFGCSSLLDVDVQGMFKSNYSIVQPSSFAAAGASTRASQFSPLSKTMMGIKGGYIKPISFFVSAKTKPQFYSALLSESSFSSLSRSMPGWKQSSLIQSSASSNGSSVAVFSQGFTFRFDCSTVLNLDVQGVLQSEYVVQQNSLFAPVGNSIFSALFSLAPKTTVAAESVTIIQSAFDTGGFSAALFQSITAVRSAAFLNSRSSASFSSAYSVGDTPKEYDHAVFVRTKQITTFVLST